MTQQISQRRGRTMLVEEAYQLSAADGSRDFGPEAVETIMSTIEGGDATVDDRPAYVFAGYPAEMKNFLKVNAGLARRITDTFYFNDYTENELCQIFLVMVKKGGFQINIENYYWQHFVYLTKYCQILMLVYVQNCFATAKKVSTKGLLINYWLGFQRRRYTLR